MSTIVSAERAEQIRNAINNTVFPAPILGTWFHSKEAAIAAYTVEEDDESLLDEPVIDATWTKETWSAYDPAKLTRDAAATLCTDLKIEVSDGEKMGLIMGKMKAFANTSKSNYIALVEALKPYVK